MAEHPIERIWRAGTPVQWLLRALLAPLGHTYLAIASLRNRLFDRGILKSVEPALPTMSIGNLTVGGTGKTPVASFLASELRARGASPGIIMRGFGGDEALVHGILSPDTPLVVAPSRVKGVQKAIEEYGCDLAVLDDGFQHRWVRRTADIVLVAAEDAREIRRGLPAGPWRERLESIRRATLAIVTRKSASVEDRDAVMALLSEAAPELPVAAMHLVPDALVRVEPDIGSGNAERRPLRDLENQSVFIIAAVGNGRAFVNQISELGARTTEALFPDHHPFPTADIGDLIVRSARADFVVCTLKDAVKLGPHWPRGAPPLWYVSQQVIIERGGDAIDAQLDLMLKARPTIDKLAGSRRPIP